MNATPFRTGRAGARIRRSVGFTLLELLVVIAVIMMLLGMLVPAIKAVREAAKRGDAKAQAGALAQALLKYRNVYNKWPAQTQGNQDSPASDVRHKAIIEALEDNPRKILFTELPVEGMEDGLLRDPWGRTYVIAMDEDNDNKVALQCDAESPSMSTNVKGTTVAVASWGRDPKDTERRIYSW